MLMIKSQPIVVKYVPNNFELEHSLVEQLVIKKFG